MKYLRSALLTSATLTTLLCTQLTYAGAFQLYELGTPLNGTAGVGQAVIASDASTSYFNPAGMAHLTASQGMLGSQMTIPFTNFSPNNATTINGNNGSNAGIFTPGLDAFYVYNYSPKFKIGMSLTTPYGGALDYNTHWVGRYNVQQMTYFTLNLNPALALQVNKWLALGAGVSIEYAYLNQSVALRLTPLLDGQVHVNVSNTSPGYNLGVLMTPTDATKIGIAFRSQIVHSLTGNIDFLNLDVTPNAHTRIVNPGNVIASISQAMTNQITLLGELGWANWSSMVNSIVTVDGFSAVTPLNWHDTYRIGLGGQYRFLSGILAQTGVSYDSSPTSSSKRLPNLPMDRQIRVGAGVLYPIVKAVVLGVSYEYMNLGNARISSQSSVGHLAGSYSRNYANFLQLSLNVSC
jgi:long-chain fatty acid transport protein